MAELKQHLKRCLDRFRTGELTEEDLQEALGKADIRAGGEPRQSLLYIQAPNSHPHASVIGMSIYEEDRHPEDVYADGKFLYTSIYEALQDGWRIIKFPEMVLAMDEQNNYGLGFEFILERWR